MHAVRVETCWSKQRGTKTSLNEKLVLENLARGNHGVAKYAC